MALNKLLTFTKTVSDLADKPALTPTALKAQFDSSPNELKDALNSLIDGLKLTTSGDSGAKNIGATTISGLTGNDVQTILGSLKTYADSLITKGSDVNGNWTKFPDGTMMAWQKASYAGDGTDNIAKTWTMTNTFVGDVAISINARNNLQGGAASGTSKTSAQLVGTSLSWTVQFGSTVPSANTITVDAMILGRWK